MALLDNLEANWTFNNNWLDSSGNGIDGVAIGATFSSAIKKLGSHSSSYDSLDDAGNFGNVLNSVFATPDAKFTVAIWFRANDIASKEQIIFSKYGDGGQSENERQFFLRVTTAGELEFLWGMSGGTSVSRRSVKATTTTLTDDTWSLLIMKYDGSIDTNDGLDRVSFKINNVSQATSLNVNTSSLGDMYAGTARLATGGYIGSSGSIVLGDTNGFIDETSIWSRLTTDEDDSEYWNSGAGVELSRLALRAKSSKVVKSDIIYKVVKDDSIQKAIKKTASINKIIP